MEVSQRGYGFLMRDGPEAPRASRDIVSFVLCGSVAALEEKHSLKVVFNALISALNLRQPLCPKPWLNNMPTTKKTSIGMSLGEKEEDSF